MSLPTKSLHTIGIDVWVSKTKPANNELKFLPIDQDFCHKPWLVLLSANHHSQFKKIKPLLQDIMLFLNIQENSCCFAMESELGFNGQGFAKILKTVNPQKTLCFGITDFNPKITDKTIFSKTVDLIKVMDNPLLKQTVLDDLYKLSI